MKRLPGYAAMVLTLGLCACAAQVGAPRTLPGNGPGGQPMITADQQAVGLNPARRDPTLYPLTVALSPQPPGAGAAGDDAYRWLEALDTPAVKQWVEGENKASAGKLAALPLKARFQERVSQIAARGGFTTGVTTYWRVRSQTAASPDGRLIATATAPDLWKIAPADGGGQPEEVHATTLAWAPDGHGVYYGGESPAGQSGIFLHRLGTPGGQDALVYAPGDPALASEVQITPDRHYLVMTLRDGAERGGITLLDLTRPGAKPFGLFTSTDANYTFIGASPTRLYFLTTRNAPSGRVISVSAGAPLGGWAGVVPEGTGPLESAAYVDGWIVTASIEDAHSVVRRYSADGRPAGEVALPGLGHVEGFLGPRAEFIYTDYLTPPTVYGLDPATGKAQPLRAPAIDTAAFVTERVFVPGAEGSRTPMYITRRRDRPRDGDQPFILQASGQLVPSFSPEVLAWLELGGAYAQVSVHPERRTGSLQARQSGLADLQDAADYLVRERYTRTRRLGLYGRGTSALVVAAAMAQRPQAYGAVVAQLTAWQGDEVRPSLDTYAPHRRIRQGVCYPPTLVTTLDHDTHVAPWEGYELTAHLKAVQFCSNPVLLHVDPRPQTPAQHADGSAAQWAFLAQWLGLEAPAG